MAEEEKPNFRRLIYVAAPVLVALYVLSYGPVLASFEPKTPAEAVENIRFISWFYYPLSWFADHFSPVAKFLDWYITLFK